MDTESTSNSPDMSTPVTRSDHEDLRSRVSEITQSVKELTNSLFHKLEASDASMKDEIKAWREEFRREQSKITDRMSDTGRIKIGPTIALVSVLWVIVSSIGGYMLLVQGQLATQEVILADRLTTWELFITREYDPLNKNVDAMRANRFTKMDGDAITGRVREIELNYLSRGDIRVLVDDHLRIRP